NGDTQRSRTCRHTISLETCTGRKLEKRYSCQSIRTTQHGGSEYLWRHTPMERQTHDIAVSPCRTAPLTYARCPDRREYVTYMNKEGYCVEHRDTDHRLNHCTDVAPRVSMNVNKRNRGTYNVPLS